MNKSINLIATGEAEQLKQCLIKKFIQEYANLGARLVYQAVNEAHALASLTFVPQLVLPLLAEEKIQQAAAWAAHQRAVLHTDRLALAA